MALNSFRTRLLLAIFGCAAVAIVAGGIFTYAMVKRHLNEEFDHFLGDKLRFHRVSCVQHGNRLAFKQTEASWERLHDPGDPEYFQFRFLDGRDAFRSYSIPENSAGLPMLGVDSDEPESADCILPNGNSGRALGVTFSPTEVDEGGLPIKVNLVVAHQRGDVDAALARLLNLILVSGSIAALLLLGATMLIVRQILRPLAGLTRQIAVAPISDEPREFSLEGAPLELEPVVERLNALMARVGAALDNERQFTNNAAHELRNPLAGLRSQVEVALERSRDPDLDEETLVKVLEVQRQMEGAVENLLALARLDSGTEKIETTPVDLKTIARRAWKPFFERASARGHKVQWDTDPEMEPFDSSPRLLEILLANLFDNATTYTPDGGDIAIIILQTGSQIRVEVSNTNPGIAPEDAGGLFKRFHRGAETSTGKRQHAGIGLSLCWKIAETLGGGIAVRASEERFNVSVSIPNPAKHSPEKT